MAGPNEGTVAASPTTLRLGVCSSVGAAASTAAFGISLAADNRPVYFTACLLISVCVVTMAVAFRHVVPGERRALADCAVAFSCIYATFVSMVYYTQLAVVLPGRLDDAGVRLVSDVPGTAFFYLDMFGYVMLCLATLFMALALEPGTSRLLRALLLLHGAILVPTYLLPYLPVSFAPSESGAQSAGGVRILIGWCALFVPICLLTARHFLQRATPQGPEARHGVA